MPIALAISRNEMPASSSTGPGPRQHQRSPPLSPHGVRHAGHGSSSLPSIGVSNSVRRMSSVGGDSPQSGSGWARTPVPGSRPESVRTKSTASNSTCSPPVPWLNQPPTAQRGRARRAGRESWPTPPRDRRARRPSWSAVSCIGCPVATDTSMRWAHTSRVNPTVEQVPRPDPTDRHAEGDREVALVPACPSDRRPLRPAPAVSSATSSTLLARAARGSAVR